MTRIRVAELESLSFWDGFCLGTCWVGVVMTLIGIVYFIMMNDLSFLFLLVFILVPLVISLFAYISAIKRKPKLIELRSELSL